jgi:hypothetical protein
MAGKCFLPSLQEKVIQGNKGTEDLDGTEAEAERRAEAKTR